MPPQRRDENDADEILRVTQPAKMLTLAWLQLHRLWGFLPTLLILIWIAVTALQEPPLLRRFEYQLFWTGLEGIAVLFALLLPLAWLLQHADGRDDAQRLIRNPLRHSLLTVCAQVAYGCAHAILILACAYALDRIRVGPVGAPPFWILAQLLLVLGCAGAFANLLWWTRLSAPVLIALWILAVLAGALWGAPIPIRLLFWLESADPKPPALHAVLASVLATGGTMLGCLALAGRRRGC